MNGFGNAGFQWGLGGVVEFLVGGGEVSDVCHYFTGAGRLNKDFRKLDFWFEVFDFRLNKFCELDEAVWLSVCEIVGRVFGLFEFGEGGSDASDGVIDICEI